MLQVLFLEVPLYYSTMFLLIQNVILTEGGLNCFKVQFYFSNSCWFKLRNQIKLT